MTKDIAVKLKEVEIGLLKAFIEVCDNNHLQYYLVEGTCLGAIRHHGFIPWDDDIDVALPRADYNIFLKIAQRELPSYYFLQTIDTDPEYIANFAKIRDCRTTFIESSVKSRKINHGVYIDIFPLDNAPEHHAALFKMKDLLYVARISAEFDSLPSAKMKILQLFSKVLLPDLKNAVKKRDKHMQSVKNSRFFTNFCSAYGSKEIMLRENYGKGTTVIFEGLDVLVPQNYDNYLSSLYGDYMTPPPVEKRIGHHSAEIIDLDKPYFEYTN